MMFGSYEYCVNIIQANSFQKACKILGTEEKIRGYNYDPKKDPDYITYSIYNLKNSNRRIGIQEIKEHFKNNSYEKLVKDCDERCLKKSITGKSYITTTYEGWYDWIEAEINVPEGYYFSDGHQG